MKEKILALRDKGYTYRCIASELGISPSKVSNIINDKFEYNKGWKRQRCIELRKSGMKVKDICKEVGLCEAVVVSYTSYLNVRLNREPERRNEIIRLSKLGFDNNLIALNMGIKKSSVYHVLYKSGLRSERWEHDNTEQMQECQALFIDGYSNQEISLYTGLRLSEVRKYTKSCKIHKIQAMKKIKKKEVKSTPLAIDQRAMLGQGVTAGVYTKEVKLRDNRDEGRLVKLLYSDLTDNPSISASIRVRDESISDELAVERWAKKNGKKSWKLVCSPVVDIF